MNLTLDAEAYALLQRYAPTRKAYGRFVSTLLQEFDRAQEEDSLRERLERLETQVQILAIR